MLLSIVEDAELVPQSARLHAPDSDRAITGHSHVHVESLVVVNCQDFVSLVLNFVSLPVRKRLLRFFLAQLLGAVIVQNDSVSIASDKIQKVAAEPQTSDASLVVGDRAQVVPAWFAL